MNNRLTTQWSANAELLGLEEVSNASRLVFHDKLGE
jgi:hypothetical protein